MRIGILGSGLMGGKLGTIWARAGHEVVFSYARSEQKLTKLAREAKGKARAGTPREAAQEADALLLAVHWSRVDDVLKQADDLSGKVIVTCSLPMNADDTGLVIAHTSSGAEELAKRVPKAQVVSAFGTVPSEVLFDVSRSGAKPVDPASSTAGTMRAARRLPLSSSATWGSIRWTPGPYGSPGTRSPSRYSSPSSRTRVTKVPSSRTASSGSGSKGLYPGMALVVFLRGVNVGGHRTFRPSILARELSDYDVVNVGAAGTFVVRKPGSRAKFRAALLRKLPFETEVMLCDGRDLIRLETENPFGTEPSRPDVVRFVSILTKAGRVRASLPVTLPPRGAWLLRVIASKNRFVFGVYRRHMKTIGYLGQMDKLCGVPVTTRNWNTIVAIVRILKGEGKKGR